MLEVIDEREDTVADPPPLAIVDSKLVLEEQPSEEVDDIIRTSTVAKLRYLKVRKFWDKKARRSFEKKIVSKNRKKIADNKLRI